MSRRWLPVLMAVAAPVTVAVTWSLGQDSVPRPLPTHWNLAGEVDATAGGAAFTAGAAAVAGVAAVLATATVLLRPRQPGARHVVGFAAGMAWLFAGLHVMVVTASAGVPRASEVPMDGWRVGAVLLAALTVAAAAVMLTPPPEWTPRHSSGAPSQELGASERAVWVGTVRSRWLLGAGFVAGAGALVMLTAAWPVTLSLSVVALALVSIHTVTVRVDATGVRVFFAVASWPRVRVPLPDIGSARVEEIVPSQWGGCGLRMSRRGTAVVVRAGAGLVVTRRDGREFAVTVDAPGDGAALVNGLVARTTTGH